MLPRILPLLAITVAIVLSPAAPARADHENDDLTALQGRGERDLVGR